MEEKYNGLCQIATGSRLGGGKAVSNFKLWMDWEKKNESVEETQCPDVDLYKWVETNIATWILHWSVCGQRMFY